MEFEEGKIVEEKTFGGLTFPKTLKPLAGKEVRERGARKLVEMIRENREWLEEALRQHSAILFRGFKVFTPEEFGEVVEAFGWEEMPYFGAISRAKLASRVYSANEAPLHLHIDFHHEMSLMKEFPSKIIFFCAEPSPKGGETSILPSSVIVEKMEEMYPEFISKLVTSGYVFQFRTTKQDDTNSVISKTWQWLLKTDDKVEALERAKEKLGCSEVRFKEDGSAEFVYGPLNPIKEIGEKRVWFHHLVGRNEGDKDGYLGDGTPLPKTILDAYKEIIKENRVDIKWEKGDVLLLDNLCVQHARRPGLPPRQILVSICK